MQCPSFGLHGPISSRTSTHRRLNRKAFGRAHFPHGGPLARRIPQPAFLAFSNCAGCYRDTWLPQQSDVKVVREEVRVSLHVYGEDKHLLPRDSERALTSMFEHVAHVAIRQHRVLTRAGFRVLFDDSTRVQRPNLAAFNQIELQSHRFSRAFPHSTSVPSQWQYR